MGKTVTALVLGFTASAALAVLMAAGQQNLQQIMASRMNVTQATPQVTYDYDDRVKRATRKKEAPSSDLAERYDIIYYEGDLGRLLYDEEDYDAVEAGLTALYAERNEGRGGARYGGAVSGLAEIREGRPPESMAEAIRRWKVAKPESHFPWMLEGKFRINTAWLHRGSGFSRTVTNSGRRGFQRDLDTAKASLERAIEMNPDDSQPHIYMITVCMGMSLPKSEMRTHFEGAKELSPQRLAVYAYALDYLYPKWHGSWPEVKALADETDALADRYPQLALVRVLLWKEMERRDYGNVDLDKEPYRGQAAQRYETVLETFPDDLETLSAYSNFMYERYDDKVKSLPAVEAMGNRYVVDGAWKNLRYYHDVRVWVYRKIIGEVGGWNKAAPYIEKAHEFAYDDASIVTNYAMLLHRRGQYAEAAAAYRDALELEPDNARTLSSVAHVYLHLDNFEEAERLAGLALDSNPDARSKRDAANFLRHAREQFHPD